MVIKDSLTIHLVVFESLCSSHLHPTLVLKRNQLKKEKPTHNFNQTIMALIPNPFTLQKTVLPNPFFFGTSPFY